MGMILFRLKRTAMLLIAAVMSVNHHCTTVNRVTHETVTSTVTVVDIAPNDLGQVMVFALDAEGNRTVFVKNFYSSLKSRAAIREAQYRCRVGLLRYKGRRVRITWYRNEPGDRVLVDINP